MIELFAAPILAESFPTEPLNQLSQYGALGIVLTISLSANGFLLYKLLSAYKDQVNHVKEITKVVGDSNFALATINTATEQRARALDRATEAISSVAAEVKELRESMAYFRDLATRAMDSNQKLREALIRNRDLDI